MGEEPLRIKALRAYGGEIAVLATLLFGAAGTTAWPAAWVFLFLYVGVTLRIGIMLAERDPALLEERLRPLMQRDQPWWDKAFLAMTVTLWPAWLFLMGLDAVRFRWSSMPLWLHGVGLGGILLASVLIWRTFRENTFLAPVVKVQARRDHTVVTTGPYAVVRHPLYAAAIAYLPSAALLLGSWYGLIATAMLALGIVLRTALEDRLLMRELDGYETYAAEVRYRLIPFVW